MKLRNKKTGEVVTEIDTGQNNETFWVLGNKPRMYETLAELNEEWEDYKPSEPLIEDEKVRKAVRTWAGLYAPGVIKVCIYANYVSLYKDGLVCIDLPGEIFRELIDKHCYSIDELCGEEEE